MTQAPDADGSADRPDWKSVTGDDHAGIDLTAPDPDPDPDDAPSAYEGTEILPPPVFSSGRYQFPGSPSTSRPHDPVVPFVAPPVSRRRRSDWPVLVVALIISAIVLAGCCIAGYAVYASKTISF
jgi:hypothetical protein